MRKDIENRQDIISLVDTFYDKVMKDSEISFFFTDVVNVDWEKHKPRMYDFWETMILQNPKYTGNPMQVHQHLNQKHKLEKKHFDAWISLFCLTVDELFEGSKTEETKMRAQTIASTMHFKITSV